MLDGRNKDRFQLRMGHSRCLCPASAAQIAGQAAGPVLRDIYSSYSFGSAHQGQFAPTHSLLPAPEQFLPEGAGFAGHQGLREASLQPWQQGAPASHTTSQQATPSGSGRQPQPDSLWAASLFASPSSTAMSSTPSKETTPPSGGARSSAWLSPLLQQVGRHCVHVIQAP
jgi:hypothetical protein